MRPVITDVPWIACLSVCAGYVCWTSCAKTAELIEMPFWVVDSGGPTEPSIRRGQDSPRGRGSLGSAPPSEMRPFVKNSLTTSYCYTQDELTSQNLWSRTFAILWV